MSRTGLRYWLNGLAGREVSRPLVLPNRAVLRLEQLECREVPSATVFDAPASTGPTVFSSTAVAQSTGTYSSQNEAYVAALYTDVLGREPDAVGLAGWLGQLNSGALTRQQVALSFLTSQENQINQINGLYEEILNRTAAPQEVQGWLIAMQNGMSYNQMRAGFYGSPEFYANAGSTNAGFLSALYQSQFGRPIDPSGQSWWTNAMNNGATPYDVAYQVVKSDESNGNLVALFYAEYLNRAPDQGGYDYWTQQLAKGRSPQYVASQILGSAEFYNNLASQVA